MIPEKGQWKEPWIADIRTGCLAIYPKAERDERGTAPCLDGAGRWAIAFQGGRGEREDLSYPDVTEEQRSTYERIASCVSALNGCDPEALPALLKYAEMGLECIKKLEALVPVRPNLWTAEREAYEAALAAFRGAGK